MTLPIFVVVPVMQTIGLKFVEVCFQLVICYLSNFFFVNIPITRWNMNIAPLSFYPEIMLRILATPAVVYM